jgi:endonuclease-3
MAPLSDPPQAANRLKRALQGVFEKYYSFEIDILRKGNLGKAIKELESINGVAPFAVSYVTQNALSGHAIPVNAGAVSLFILLDVVTEAEAEKGRIPGLERTIPKTKGVEFGSLLHQLAVDFASSPMSPKFRAIILEIDPAAKDRLPKRASTKEAKKAPSKNTGKAEPSPKSGAAPKPKEAEAGKKAASKRLAKKKPR